MGSDLLDAGRHDGSGGTAWIHWRAPRPSTWRRRFVLRAFVLAARLVGLRVWIGEYRSTSSGGFR